MKKIFAIVSLISMVTIIPASAKSEGNITLRDGRRVLRINVGNEDRRDSRSMVRRIKRLERAVRNLQNKVYDLQDETRSREVTIYTCSLATSFDGTFIGKAQTKVEARANTVNACRQAGGFPCRDYNITSCTKSIELLR